MEEKMILRSSLLSQSVTSTPSHMILLFNKRLFQMFSEI